MALVEELPPSCVGSKAGYTLIKKHEIRGRLERKQEGWLVLVAGLEC